MPSRPPRSRTGTAPSRSMSVLRVAVISLLIGGFTAAGAPASAQPAVPPPAVPAESTGAPAEAAPAEPADGAPAPSAPVPSEPAPSEPLPDTPSPDAPTLDEGAPAAPVAGEPAPAAPPQSDASVPSTAPAGALPAPANTEADCAATPVREDDRSELDACLERTQPMVDEQYREALPNPDLGKMCGAGVALVLDGSASIGRNGVQSLKRAADQFTSALSGTGSQASVTTFGSDAKQVAEPTDLNGAGVAAVQSSYAGLQPAGWTNWAAGLVTAKNGFDRFKGGNPDIAILVTDGNANTVAAKQPGWFRDGSAHAVNPAITQANLMKARGTHVFVVAVGDLDLTAITALSGTREFTGDNLTTADYVTTDSYDTLAGDLQALAVALCSATMKIEKVIDGNRIPDWEFSARSDDVSPRSLKTGLDGWTDEFEVTGFTSDRRLVSFAEELRPFYRMSAIRCSHDVTDQNMPAGTWSVYIRPGDAVNCTIQNAGDPSWSVTQQADPPSGTAVRPGDQIDYTITVQHEGGPTATGLEIVDDISELAPYADFEGFIGTQPSSFAWDSPEQPDRLTLGIDELAPGQQLEFTYRVTVRDDLKPGTVLQSKVLTRCAPSIPETDPCATEHPTPGYVFWKTADPAGTPGAAPVQPGATITYTLHAWNMFGETDVDGATAVDDLSGVFDHATLVGELDPALQLDGDRLTWTLPTLSTGSEPVSVSFQVQVAEDAWGVDLKNVATPDREGICLSTNAADRPCETEHRTPDVDLNITKSADPGIGVGEPVESGANPADTISYEVVIENSGTDPAYVVDAEDLLPQGVTIDASSVAIVTSPDPHDMARWTFSEPSLGRAQFSHDGAFMPGARATITFDVAVGTLERPDPAAPIPDLVNQICVSHSAPSTDAAATPAADSGDGSSPTTCATATTPVKSVAVEAVAMCVANAPWLDYRVTAANVADLSTVALIWWTPAAFAARNPAISPADTAALLADGASQVDRVEPAGGWAPGKPLTGRRLWPGAAVDPSGAGSAWPGWAHRSDDTWVLDPTAPFYDLRSEAVVEVRVNPSASTVVAYPAAQHDCIPAPPNTVPRPSAIAHTGVDTTPFWAAGFGLAVLGFAAFGFDWARRRRSGGRHTL